MAFVSSSSGIVIVDSRSNSGSIRLPAASTLVGRSLIFKDGFNSFGSHPLGLSTTGVDRFDNLSSVLTLAETNGFVSLVAGSNKWHTVGGTHLVNQNVDNMTVSSINRVSISNNLYVSSITLTNSLSLNYTDTIPTNVIPSYPFTSSFNVVAYGNGQWLAGGLEGNVSSIALLSNNNWIPITTNLKQVNSISYGNGKWLATGIPINNSTAAIQVSQNGITWSNAVFTVNLSSFVGNTIAYGSNFWLCGGTSSRSDCSLQTSVDGYNWLGQTSPLSNVYSLTYGPFVNDNYHWVLGGSGSPSGPYNVLYTSTDGSNWTNFDCPLNGGQANTVAFGDDNACINFIGGGFDVSYNNANSIQVYLYGSGGLTAGSNNLNIVNSIAYNNGVWVSVGQIFSTFSNAIQVSPNGFNWSPISTNMAIGQTVAYGGGQWIAGGYTAASTAIVQYSIDGFHWSFSNYSTCTLSTVVTANSNGLIVNGAQSRPSLGENFCVAVGYNGLTNYPCIATSYDGVNWLVQSNNVFSNAGGLNSIAYNGSIWMTCGIHSIFTSSDGFNWLPVNTNVIGGGDPRCIVWNGSYWMIIEENNVTTSYDGYNWTYPSANPLTGGQGFAVAWNGSYWLALGYSTAGYFGGYLLPGPSIFISTDGSNWNPASNNPFNSVYNYGVVYAAEWNGSYWVAVGGGGSGCGIAISYDGYNWTASPNNPFNSGVGYGVAWNDSYWVAVGQGNNICAAKSFNGIDWIPCLNNFMQVPIGSGSGGYAKKITWNGSLWIAVGSGKQIATSTDGLYWTPIAQPILSVNSEVSAVANRKVKTYKTPDPQNLNISSITFPGLPNTFFNTSYSYGRTDYGSTFLGITSTNIKLYLCNATTVAYGNGLWLVSGFSSNTYDNNANTVILRSSDTSNWAVSFLTPFNTAINSIVYGSNRWVAVGQDGETGSNSIYTSIDAITWVPSCNNPLYLNGFSQYKSVTYGGGNKWVAVGTNYGSNPQAIVYSTDGLTWSLASNNPFTGGVSFSVGYGNGLWIAGGSGTSNIATSSNGIDWDAAQSNPFDNGVVLNIKYANGLWIAVGIGGNGYNIMSSPDGSNWTPSSLVTGFLRTAAYGDGKWIVGGQGGVGPSMFISTDGINWSSITNNFEGGSSYGVQGIAYGNSTWLSVGNYNTIDYISTIQTSSNGLDWTMGTASQTLSTLQYASSFSYISSFSTFSSPITIVNSTMSNVVSITSNSININGSPYSPPYFQTSALNLNYIDIGDDIPSHPFTNSITSIAYGNNQWLAAGSNTGCNIIAMWNYSNAWVTVYNNSEAINNLSYNNNQWLGVGSNIIVVSHDGYTWSNATSFTPAVLNTVAYNSTFWLAGGQTLSNTGSIQLSADGFNWYSQSTLISSVNSITYASNIWVAVGSTIETSYDGSNWLPQSSFLQQGNTLAYSEGLWLSGGFDSNYSRSSIQLSLDASNWGFAYSYDLNIVNSIAYNDNFKFVAVGKNANCASNAIIYSYNGSVWYTPSTIMGVGTTIAYGNNLAIAGGYTPDGKPVIQYSDNGEFWLSYHLYNKINSTIITSFFDNLLVNGEPKIQTGSFIGANISLYYDSIINVPRENVHIGGSEYSNVNAILYANNVLMIGINGANTLSNSPDSIQVLNNNVWVPQLNGMPIINGIDYGNGAWVSVGSIGTTFDPFIQISSDGSNWTPITPSGNAPGFCVKYANGIWLVGNIGNTAPQNVCSMQGSTDGYNWYLQSNNLGIVRKIDYGNGLWVAVGESIVYGSTIQTSIDGSNWTTQVNSLQVGYSIKYANNLWVVGGTNTAFGNTTTIQTSSDGSNWSPYSNILNQVNDIAYNNGIWLAVGSNATNSNQCIQTSSNGSDWTAQTASYLIYAKSIAYSNGVWMVGGQALVNYGGGKGPDAVGLIEYSYDTINWTSTFVGTKEVTASTIVTGASNSILLNSVPIIQSQDLTSTIQGLGTSMTQDLISTIEGLGTFGYLSTGVQALDLTSTVQSIESSAIKPSYIGSTIEGLGTFGYLSTGIQKTDLTSSIQGLGTTGYLSSPTRYITDSFCVAGGVNYHGQYCLQASYDGFNWQLASNQPFGGTDTGQVNGVSFNGSYWLASGNGNCRIAISYDGFNWTASSNDPFGSNGIARASAWNGSYWVVVGTSSDNTICMGTSSDGLNWTPSINNPFSNGGATGVAWNGYMWLATGSNTLTSNGIAIGDTTASIIISYDGLNWNKASNDPFSATVPYTGVANGIAWNGSYWVAVGRVLSNGGAQPQTIAVSSDGFNWQLASNNPFSAPSGGGATIPQGNKIAWTGSKWLAVGVTSSNEYSMAVSTDGYNWTYPSANPFTGGACTGITWNGSYWIACANTGSIATSPDTINWTLRPSYVNDAARLAIASRIVLPYLGKNIIPAATTSLYIPSNPSIWEAPPPSTIQGALDRLASFLSAFTSSNIPL